MKKTSDAITDSMMNASTSAGLLAGADVADAHIQSYTLSFDMSRTPIQKLGFPMLHNSMRLEMQKRWFFSSN